VSQIQIDQSLCKNDGICVETCPVGVLEMAQGPKGPSIIETRRDRCIRCGHCEAVCAAQALSWDDRPRSGLTPIEPEANVTAEQAEQWLKARRSIRAYKSTLVPKEVIGRMLETARWAPSGHNRQPVSWTVLSGPEKVGVVSKGVIEWMRGALSASHPAAERLGFGGLVRNWDKGEDLICRRAPHLVFAHAPPTEMAAAGACTIAVTYLQLASFGHGLGTCWAGYVMAAMSLEPKLAQLLSLPEGHQVFAATLLGYPKFTYRAIPERNPLVVRWQ
jgi:nitroreductase/NAD-dependent dihydropyrimidine dehydrogenase PreA subunit